MKASELREKSLTELVETLDKQQHKLFGLKMASQDPGNSDSQNLKKGLRAMRRDIARIQTVINQKKQQTLAG